MWPIELLDVRERDIDLNLGVVVIRHNKVRGDYKMLKLLDEDLEEIKAFPRGLPDLHFFRHEKGPHAGKRYGKDRLYANWKRACQNLGIKGLKKDITDHELDAVSGALVGYLFLQNRAEALGDFKQGAILLHIREAGNDQD